MKKLTLISLAALTMAACSNDEHDECMNGRQELRLTSVLEAATRGDVQSLQIAEGEKVWTWVNKTEGSAPLYKALQLTADVGGVLKGTTPIYFPEAGGAVDVFALHGKITSPEINAGATDIPAEVGFEVAADQSGTDFANYKASDLLYAVQNKVEAGEEASTTCSLRFYHMLSKLEVDITLGDGVKNDIQSVTLDGVALNGTFIPNAEADLAKQSDRVAMIKVGEDVTGKLTLSHKLKADGSNDAIVVPQSIAGKKLTFNLPDNVSYSYTFPEGKTFESGKKHHYNVTLTNKGLEVDSTIEDWESAGEENNGTALN